MQALFSHVKCPFLFPRKMSLFRVSEMTGFTPAQFRPNSGLEYALFEAMPGRADMNIDKH